MHQVVLLATGEVQIPEGQAGELFDRAVIGGGFGADQQGHGEFLFLGQVLQVRGGQVAADGGDRGGLIQDVEVGAGGDLLHGGAGDERGDLADVGFLDHVLFGVEDEQRGADGCQVGGGETAIAQHQLPADEVLLQGQAEAGEEAQQAVDASEQAQVALLGAADQVVGQDGDQTSEELGAQVGEEQDQDAAVAVADDGAGGQAEGFGEVDHVLGELAVLQLRILGAGLAVAAVIQGEGVVVGEEFGLVFKEGGFGAGVAVEEEQGRAGAVGAVRQP